MLRRNCPSSSSASKKKSITLLGGGGGLLRSTSLLRMRFDNKKNNNNGGESSNNSTAGSESKMASSSSSATPRKPRFLELPKTMQSVTFDAHFTPFPLPAHDAQSGFGAPSSTGGSMDYTEAPDALKAMRQLSVEKRKAPAPTMTAEDDLGDAMFFGDDNCLDGSETTPVTTKAQQQQQQTERQDDEETFSSAIPDETPPLPTAPPVAFHDPTGTVKVHPWRPDLYSIDTTQERSPEVIQRPSGRNLTMPDLVARWKACREYRDERKLVLADFQLNLEQYSNGEIIEFLSILSASFDPGKNLELWQFQKTCDARNGGNFDSAAMYADTFLDHIYRTFDAIEDLLVMEQSERLLRDPASTGKLLSTLGHMKILDKVGNWTYDYKLVQGLGRQHQPRSYSNVVHRNMTGHRTFDMVVDLLESQWASEQRAEWSVTTVVDLFASLVAAENPEYKPVPNSLLNIIPSMVLQKIHEAEARAVEASRQRGGDNGVEVDRILDEVERSIIKFVLSCSLLPRHGLSVLSCYDGTEISKQPGHRHSAKLARTPTNSMVTAEDPYNKVIQDFPGQWAPSTDAPGPEILQRAYMVKRPTPELLVALSTQRPLKCKSLLAVYKRLVANQQTATATTAITDSLSLRDKNRAIAAAAAAGSEQSGESSGANYGSQGECHTNCPTAAGAAAAAVDGQRIICGDQSTPTAISDEQQQAQPAFLAPVDPTLYRDDSVVWSQREEMLVAELATISANQEKLRQNAARAMMDTLKAFPSPTCEKVKASGGAYGPNGIMDPVPVVHSLNLNKELLMSIDFEDLGPNLVRAFERAKKVLPTYAGSLERVRSWDKAFLVHSSCCKREVDQIIQLTRGLEGGKVGAILSTQTLLTIHQRAVTSTEWIVRESNKTALRIIMEELTSQAESCSSHNSSGSSTSTTGGGGDSNMLLVPFSEELAVSGNQGDWFDEDALMWILAQHLVSKVKSVAPIMLMDRLEPAQEQHNCFRGDINGNSDTATLDRVFTFSLGALGRKGISDTAVTITDNRRQIQSYGLRHKVQVLQFPRIGGTGFDSAKMSGDRFGMYQQFNSYTKGRQWKHGLQRDRNYKDRQFELGEGGQQIEGRSRNSADDFGRHGIMAIPGSSDSEQHAMWRVPESEK